MSIKIHFNGEQKAVQSSTVVELLKEFNLTDRKVAVELNREIVPRERYGTAKLAEGDKVEIVHFVGGG